MPSSLLFPATAADLEQLLRTHVLPAEAQDALEVKPTAAGTSFFFHGTKISAFSIMKKLGATWYLPNSLLQSIGGGSLEKDDIDLLPIRSLLPHEIDQILAGLKELEVALFLEQSAYVFGCCNDFLRCSDARACLHPRDRVYLGCQYRKNLEAGRIFYGTNRNVGRTAP